MITGWLLRIVLSLVIAGLGVVELGSPLVTRAQIDGIAHDAANSAALDYLDHNDFERAQEVAKAVADDKDVSIEAFGVEQGEVRVTMARKARSLVLKSWGRTKSWYDVRVTATARGTRSGR